ncbi:Crp/Fnr family transcriptional regulator [bacterium]|nr:Crp/Fnr family transcriptional regulator [bacterium]
MLNRLAEVPLFQGLDRPALEYLGQRLHPRLYKNGEDLFGQGDQGDGLFLIEQGVIRVYRVTPAGKEITLALRGAGEYVGDMSLLDGLPRSASACAQGGDCHCGFLHKDDLHQLLRQQPEAALTMLRVLSRRLREAGDNLEELAFSTIQQRLASLLLRLCRVEGQKEGAETLLPGWVSYQSLSTMLGTARECVNRVAVSLVDCGALARRGRRLVIPNVDVLEAIHLGEAG